MPIDVKNEVAALNLGGKIRQLRNQRGYTLENVSKMTGISKPHLSQIENEIVSPPIGTLLKISSALGVKISFFFQDSPGDDRIVVSRKGERTTVNENSKTNEFSNMGYTYELLANQFPEKYMEPVLVYMEHREVKDLVYNNHKGEEFVFLLEGKLEFRCADQIILLDEGDSLFFDSRMPHAYRGIGGMAKFIGVLFSLA